MRGARPRGGFLLGRPARARLLGPLSATTVCFPQNAVISEVFHRGNRCHRFGRTIGVTGVIFGPDYRGNRCHIQVRTDQVVQPDKYVQANGLFIFGSEELKNGRSDLEIRGAERERTPVRRFSSVFHPTGCYCSGNTNPQKSPDSLHEPGVSTAAPSSAPRRPRRTSETGRPDGGPGS